MGGRKLDEDWKIMEKKKVIEEIKKKEVKRREKGEDGEMRSAK